MAILYLAVVRIIVLLFAFKDGTQVGSGILNISTTDGL
jgi:hypothetical protein